MPCLLKLKLQQQLVSVTLAFVCLVTLLLESCQKLATCVTLALATKAIDTLVLTFLRLDEAGRILADLLSRRPGLNPIRVAQRLLVSDLRSGLVFKLVTTHFEMAVEKQVEHMSTTRSFMIQFASAIHYRVDLYFSRWPFLILAMVHPDRTREEQLAAARRMYTESPCCLDPFLCAKLRLLFATPEALVASERVRKLLLAWLNRGKTTVAHVERLHASRKMIFAASRTVRRHIEGAVYNSHCRKLMAWHVRRGHRNYSLLQNDARFASRLGVRLDKTKRRWAARLPDGRWGRLDRHGPGPVAKARGRPGGNLRWRFVGQKSQHHKRQRGNESWSREEEVRARRAWQAEWDDMTAHEQDMWQQLNVGPPLMNDNAAMMPEPAAVPDLLDMLLDDTGRIADSAATGSDDFDVAARSRHTFPVDLGDNIWPVAVTTYADFLSSEARARGFA